MNDDFDDQMNMYKVLAESGMHYAAIPDIHGDINELDRVLALVEGWRKHNKVAKNNIQYVFLGDYIDRGPSPKEVILRVKEYVDGRGAVCLLGNHDLFLVGTGDMSRTQFENGKTAYQSHLWSINGGVETCVQLYGNPTPGATAIYPESMDDLTGTDVNIYRNQILESMEYKFLKDHGKMHYETEDIFFCHAPQSDKEYTYNSLTWGRRSDYSNPKGDGCFITPNNKKMSVHGHFHRLGQGINFPRVHNYTHGGVPKTVILADTGCGCGSNGRLMAVIVKEYTINRNPRIMAIL